MKIKNLYHKKSSIYELWRSIGRRSVGCTGQTVFAEMSLWALQRGGDERIFYPQKHGRKKEENFHSEWEEEFFY